MRIVAGIRRGAKIIAPKGLDIRPTADRVRQALFNILDGGKFPSPYKNGLIIDAFSGTGALGLEALSRGAAKAIFIEKDVTAQKILKQNIKNLGFNGAATVIKGDATTFAKLGSRPAKLILLDPPYQSNLCIPCIEALRSNHWLNENTLIVLELSSSEILHIPSWMKPLDTRKYGTTKLVFATVSTEHHPLLIG